VRSCCFSPHENDGFIISIFSTRGQNMGRVVGEGGKFPGEYDFEYGG
jgi:hypothetical protein